MRKISLLYLLCFLTSCCSTKDDINQKVLDSVCEIHIKNRASHRFGGIKEYKIKDKKEIISFYKELNSLKKENNLQTRPFKGTILIEFMKRDKDGTGEYINILSTGIVFKPDNEYFIDCFKGQYVSDHFLARILNYLEIDESKVSALNNYRKSSEKNHP